MKIGLVTIAYNEQRLIEPFLKHVPSWVTEKLVLVSTKPWQGSEDPKDATSDIATRLGAAVIEYPWANEQEQRNAGQEYFADFDWVIVLDPDEFLTRSGWAALKRFIESEDALFTDAFLAWQQYTYWKHGYRISPVEDYRQIILVRPFVRFVDKRVVNTGYDAIPIRLHHMSWARTDKEVKSKITHYAHAHELDPAWYNRVWLKWVPAMRNLHPLSPQALRQAIPAKLPADLQKLNIWPPFDEVETV